MADIDNTNESKSLLDKISSLGQSKDTPTSPNSASEAGKGNVDHQAQAPQSNEPKAEGNQLKADKAEDLNQNKNSDKEPATNLGKEQATHQEAPKREFSNNLGSSDAHEILGIDKNATAKDIRAAYHAAALKYHPDKNSNNPEAAANFKKIQEAYEKLNNGAQEASPATETKGESANALPPVPGSETKPSPEAKKSALEPRLSTYFDENGRLTTGSAVYDSKYKLDWIQQGMMTGTVYKAIRHHQDGDCLEKLLAGIDSLRAMGINDEFVLIVDPDDDDDELRESDEYEGDEEDEEYSVPPNKYSGILKGNNLVNAFDQSSNGESIVSMVVDGLHYFFCKTLSAAKECIQSAINEVKNATSGTTTLSTPSQTPPQQAVGTLEWFGKAGETANKSQTYHQDNPATPKPSVEPLALVPAPSQSLTASK